MHETDVSRLPNRVVLREDDLGSAQPHGGDSPLREGPDGSVPAGESGYAPLASAKPRADAEVLNHAAVAQRGTKTILVADEEFSVRLLVVTALSRLGYRVISAASAAQALNIWGERQGDIDLVITDIKLPERITGMQLAVVLRAERPRLPLLFTSCDDLESAQLGYVLLPLTRFLSKPYSAGALCAMVRQLLEESSTFANGYSAAGPNVAGGHGEMSPHFVCG